MSNLKYCIKCSKGYLLENGHNCPMESFIRITTPTDSNLPILKEFRDTTLKKAEMHAYNYARELNVGSERLAAFEVYERIRTALRS